MNFKKKEYATNQQFSTHIMLTKKQILIIWLFLLAGAFTLLTYTVADARSNNLNATDTLYDCINETVVSQLECEAFVAFFNAANFPESMLPATSSSVCFTSIATCSGGTITEINGVTTSGGTLSPQIGQLANLEELDISFMQLGGVIPGEIGQLSNLKVLRMYWNEFSGTVPASIGNLQDLERLELGGAPYPHTRLNAFPTAVYNLPNLTSLSIRNFDLAGTTIPAGISNLTQLEVLNLSGNGFTGAIPAELGSLPNLISLNIGVGLVSNNSFTGTIPIEFANLTNLTSLNVSQNPLTGPFPTVLLNMSSLSYVKVNNTGLQGQIPFAILTTQVRYMDFINTNLCVPAGGPMLPWALEAIVVFEYPLTPNMICDYPGSTQGMGGNISDVCPFCNLSNISKTSSGVDTKSRSYEHEEDGISLPANGLTVEHSLSYSSDTNQSVSVNSVGATSTVGSGQWVHNYELKLVLDDAQTEVPGTVELQTGSGARVPFYKVDAPNGGLLYVPYAGVTATMTETISGTYMVTGYEQTVFMFNDIGQLIEKQDPSGNSITFEYYDNAHPQAGKLFKAKQDGRFLTYAYDSLGRLETITDPISRTITYSYNSTSGMLETMTNPNGEVKTFTYQNDLLTEINDGSNKDIRTIEYDSSGKVMMVKNGVQDVITEISDINVTERSVTEQGVVTKHVYDDRGSFIRSQFLCNDGTTGCQAEFVQENDYNFRQNRVVDHLQNETLLTWDALGSNLTNVTNPLGDQTNIVYDDLNNTTRVTDGRSNATQMFYDDAAHPTFMTKIVDAIGQTSVFTPTATGLLAAKQGIDGIVTTYQYNDFGQPTEMRVGSGTSSEIVTFIGYDLVGRQISVTQHSPSGAFDDITTLTVYDNADRVIATIENWIGNDPSNWQADCDQTTITERDENVCSTTVYDGAGRVFKTTNTLGQVSLTYYDDAGRPELTISNQTGLIPTNPYDLCTWDDPNGADPEENLCSSTMYDSFSRVTATRDPLGRWSRTEYDSLGRVAGTIANSVNLTALNQCQFPPTNPDQDLCRLNSYDSNSNLILATDQAGRKTQMFYDALNRMEGQIINSTEQFSSIDQFGTCFGLASDRDSDLCTQYEYDEVGNMTIVTDPSGRQTRTFYDALNRVEAHVANWDGVLSDPASCVYDANNLTDTNICTKPGYDTNGRQTETTNALGQTTLSVYDEIGRPFLTVTNWDGTTPITQESDCSFPPAKADTNVCNVTYFDDLGRRSGTKDPLGNQVDFAYDDLGRMTTTTRYLDTGSGIVPVITTTGFDGLGNRVSSIDPENNTATTTFDGLNRVDVVTTQEGVTRTQTYNALGWVQTTRNGLNQQSTNSYDGLGRIIGTTNPENELTQYLFDALGNQIAMIDANNVQTSYLFDQLNRLESVIENDAGQDYLATNLDPNSDDQDLLTDYQYNVRGSLVEITNARGYSVTVTTYDDLERPIAVANALDDADATVYDAIGNVRTYTDRNGEIVSYSYDGLNRPVAIHYQSDNELIEFAYDAIGNRKVMTDGVGTTSYVHDTLYRVTSVNDALSNTVGYEYDLRGNRTKIVYPDGREVSYEYDGDSRLTKVTDWNSDETIYTYDGASRLKTTTLPNGVVATNFYDDAGRLERLTYLDSSGDLIADFDYQLDDVGNRIGVTETLKQPGAAQGVTAFLEQNGQLVLEAESGEKTAGATHDWTDQTIQSGSSGSYSRTLPDIGERLPSSSLPANGPNLGYKINVANGGDFTVWVRGMAPDPAGDSLHVSIDGAHVGALSGFEMQEWSWSKLSMAGEDLATSLTGLHDLDLHMREDGLRVDKILLTNDPSNQPTNLGPDESPTGSVGGGGQSSHSIVYTYDDLYRLTNASYTGDISANYSYAYDEVGNMDAYTETLATEVTIVTRTFNGFNQNVSENEVGIGSTAFTYDQNGNMILETPPAPSGRPMKLQTYNQRNLLTEYEESTGTPETLAVYLYDGNNDRLRQTTFDPDTSQATQINYTNDSLGLTQVLVSDDGQRVVYNLFGHDLIGQQVNGNPQFRVLIGDHAGSVRTEMFGDQVMAVRTYGPYGEVIVEVGDVDTQYGYTGEQYDSVTGYLYLRARYYDPTKMMFMARDPFEGDAFRPGTYNLYIYSLNNPVNYTDPTGEFALSIVASMATEAAVDVFFQMAIGYFFDPAVDSWSSAYDNIDWWQVTMSAASGLIPGGRLTRAAVIAAGDVILNYARSDCNSYTLSDAGFDFAIGIGSELIGEYAGELVSKYGVDIVQNGFRRMNLGIDVDGILRSMGFDVPDTPNPPDTPEPPTPDSPDGNRPNSPSITCDFNSFDATTLVLTEDGKVEISKLKLGDEVYAYNEVTDEIGLYSITDYFIHLDPEIVYLTIDGELIETTPEHPFYTAENEWVNAGELEVGDEIRTASWDFGIVEQVLTLQESQLMYNFTVNKAHTYFVGDGEWLVHNVDVCPPKYLIHYTTAQGYDQIKNGGFKLKPSPAELTANPGVYFGDPDPLFPEVPYSQTSLQALWGISDRTNYFLIDTSKLQNKTWKFRDSNTTRREWILESNDLVDISSAVIDHGHISKLND